jgi:hypothetical protein
MNRLALLALLVACGARAEDSLSLDLRAQGEARAANPANPYGVQDWSHLLKSAEMRWQWDAPLATAVRGVVTARAAGDEPGHAHVNELSLERAFGAGFVSVGKKVMSWDVGYAFRPLDVVQQEDRRALYPPTLEGVPMLAWETFGESNAMTLVVSNPGRRLAAQPRDDGSVAMRFYARRGSTDQYAVLRFSQRNGAEGGLSFSTVSSDALELHGSFLLQQRHDTWTGTRWLGQGGGGKAMAGMTWTTAGKFSLLAEAWLDRTALAAQQRNLLLRGSQNAGDAEVAADVLWQPASGSKIASVSASWTAAPWAFSLGVRHFGGVSGAVIRRAAIATLQRSF